MRILIVGGGIGGMAAAIALASDGHGVELVDLDPEWRVYGAGITITGPTLRAYKRLGLLAEIEAQGAITNGARIYRHDGTFLQELDEPVLEEGLPATGGIMRPVLHRIMQARVAALGVAVRLGVTVDALEQDGDGVAVRFSDGAAGRYDVVVGGTASPRACARSPFRAHPSRRRPGRRAGASRCGARPALIAANSIWAASIPRGSPRAARTTSTCGC